MMSSKNELQEYFQKRKCPIPNYLTEKIGGPSHEPLFRSQISFENKTFVGEVMNSKKDAEMSVAKKALQHLQKPVTKKVLKIKTYLIVDLENKAVEKIWTEYDNLKTIGICSRNCTVKNVPFEKITVESLSKDSADTAIILFIAKLILKNECTSIILLTKDHFGKTVEECIKSTALSEYNHASVYHAVNVEEVTNYLDSLTEKCVDLSSNMTR